MEDKAPCTTCGQSLQQRYDKTLKRLTEGLDELDAQRFRMYWIMGVSMIPLSPQQRADYDLIKSRQKDSQTNR